MNKIQRIYGKGRYNGFVAGIIVTALITILGYLLVKKQQTILG